MTFLSDRANNINVSGIRKVFALAQKLENPINLSIGQPDFDVPQEIKDQATKAIEKGCNGYTPSKGIEPLCSAINEYLQSKNCMHEDVMITSGVSGGLMLSIMALLNPGDEVLIPDPYFVMYEELPKLFNIKVTKIDTYPDFLLTPELIKKHLNPQTKVLFLNTPSNPTGKIIPKTMLQDIADILKGSNVWVISDDIYNDFDYEAKHIHFGSLYEKTITLGGFSKNASMTGWRVGYAASTNEVINAMIKLQQYSFVCSPSIAQHAAIHALDLDLRTVIDQYRIKRDFVYDSLKDHYNIIKPDGAFYYFLSHPEKSGDAIVEDALKKELMLIPGSVFSQKNTHFRLSYAQKDSVLEKGINILKTL